MNIDYSHIFGQIARSLRHYHGIQAASEIIRGADMFPESKAVTANGQTGYAIRFNPKVQTVLSLYNLAMGEGTDIGETVCHYALFHAFLELDDYEGARRHLDAFRQEIKRLSLDRRTQKQHEDAHGQLLVQLYFIMLHESFHIIFRHSPESGETAAETTRELLHDMKDELADQLSLITEDELLSHPKTQQHIDGLIPQELLQEEREEMAAKMHEEMKSHPYSTDYIDQLINGSDNVLLEELACDRQAWLNFTDMAVSDGCTSEDLLLFHLWFFVVFCAMDFNRVLLSQYRPAIHTRYKYDGRRVVLRHKAFKTLLRQYNPDVYRFIDHQYLELHKGLEAIFRTATLGIYKYQEDFARLYILHQERTANPILPDIRELHQLEAEMEKAAYAL
ncbi:MAG: hypothetical protein Q4F85_11570 [Prevotella sp.]|nr:hypothetical protein [Prevotella sp.]